MGKQSRPTRQSALLRALLSASSLIVAGFGPLSPAHAAPEGAACGAEGIELHPVDGSTWLLSGLSDCPAQPRLQLRIGDDLAPLAVTADGRFTAELASEALDRARAGQSDLEILLPDGNRIPFSRFLTPPLNERSGIDAAPTLGREQEEQLQRLLPPPVRPSPEGLERAAPVLQVKVPLTPEPDRQMQPDEQALLDFAYAQPVDPQPATRRQTTEDSEQALLDAAYASLGAVGASSGSTPAGLSIGFGQEGAASWLLWDREQHYIDNEMAASYQPGGDWFDQMDAHHSSEKANPTADDRRARRGSDNPPLTIDLVWRSAVDLDLHVFEPASQQDGRASPAQPGHLWSRAPAALQQAALGRVQSFAFDADRQLSVERYQLDAANAARLSRPLLVYVDYADRSQSDNRAAATCGNGGLAAPAALVRVRSARGQRDIPVKIAPLACGTPLSLATSLTAVGQISYR